MAGVLVVLTLLLFAVQVLLSLYATSTVTAAAFDAARLVAGGAAETDRAAAARDAEAHARRLLGRYGTRVRFDWSATTVDEVVLRVQASTPSLVPIAVRRPLRLDTVDRTVRVRVERLR